MGYGRLLARRSGSSSVNCPLEVRMPRSTYQCSLTAVQPFEPQRGLLTGQFWGQRSMGNFGELDESQLAQIRDALWNRRYYLFTGPGVSTDSVGPMGPLD